MNRQSFSILRWLVTDDLKKKHSHIYISLPGTNISQGTFDDFRFPKVGYVSFQEGNVLVDLFVFISGFCMLVKHDADSHPIRKIV